LQHVRNNDPQPYEIEGIRKDGTRFPAHVAGRALPYQGRSVRGTIIRDLRLQRQAEQMLRQTILQEEQLQLQAARLAELSTPLIPLSDEIMVMPLIGSVDTQRAHGVMTSLLEGISRSRAHTAILDITGVPVVDTQVADTLIRAAKAVKLLGTQLILTGIRPEVAQTLVVLGADLRDIITKSTLQSGIAYAMKSTST
jgi:anti-anti-sigma factor